VHLDGAGCVARDGAIHGDRALVEKVERPDVQRASGEIDSCGCARLDSHLAWKLLRR
jgi:hypothetical protein